MLTTRQIQTVQIARRKVGLGEEQYRTLLKNVADVESSRSLSQSDFEDVMAVLEDLGYRDARSPSGDYWRTKVALRGTFAGERLVYKITSLHAQAPRYPLEAMCRRFSGDRATTPGKLRPREALQLVEALKAIVAREHAAAQAKPLDAPVTDDEVSF